MSPHPAPPMGWTIYDSYWQVETCYPNGDIEEKIAYCNSFVAARAAYEATLIERPRDRIIFRNRARVIAKNWSD